MMHEARSDLEQYGNWELLLNVSRGIRVLSGCGASTII
jgi:hypothetical protein